nr:putative ribonuclease H-like domain-containing protein [Tanacetum cinerariifolium]
GYLDWWTDGHKTASNKGAEKDKPSTSRTANTRTGWIIGRGTKRDGLYYVDEVVQSSTVMLAHGTTEREAWLWHRRLGRPSVSSSQTNNLDNPQPDNLDNPQLDNLDETNADDIQDSTSKILQEHEEDVPRKYVLPSRSNRGVPLK